jgi:UDP-GlcNAc:undecaprenyl-phosphate GlcNAc-1-phosphate transferase
MEEHYRGVIRPVLAPGARMIAYILVFLATLGSALVLTFVVRHYATAFGIVDVPDGTRRLHERPVPRVGGVAVSVSIMGVVGVAVLSGQPGLDLHGSLLPLMLGGLAIFAIGLWDDIRGLGPRTKFALETVVALALFAAGIRIEGFGLPGGHFVVFPTLVALLVTVLWIVGVTNAFNLIDGSDGVAAGAALFASGGIAVVSIIANSQVGILFSLALVGGTLGFLFFNFPPATIFLGDSGSLFLGFTLATLGIVSTQMAPTTLAVAIPVVSFGLPILDTVLAMLRRFLRREPLFHPDRGHIHHRLRDLGHSPRTIALLLYAASAGFALLSLLLVTPTGGAAGAVLIVLGLVILLAIQRLRIPEFREFGRIINRGFQQRAVIANNLRVRRGGAVIRSANTLTEVLNGLSYALDTGEFARIELWLDEPLPASADPNGNMALRDGLHYWSSTAEWVRPGDQLWEIRLPFRRMGAAPGGYIALWQNLVSEEHFLTDLRLVGVHLLDELEAALERIRTHAPQPWGAGRSAEFAGFER